MGISQSNIKNVEVRLAQDKNEVKAAQRLRYKVFYEEHSAKPSDEMAQERLDKDAYDAVSDHLVVVDHSIEDPDDRIVGTYRLLRHEAAKKHGQFYTADEYDISSIMQNGKNIMELGRSCVLAEYRTRPVLQLLWEGIVEFTLSNDVGLLFGCASLHGTNIDSVSEQLAYLHHYHLAAESVRPKALANRYIDMNLHDKDDLDAKECFKALPPLIKGYLRAGACIGEGAVIDEQFNTIDVCIVLPTKEVSPRYKKHYSRKTNRDFPSNEDQDVMIGSSA